MENKYYTPKKEEFKFGFIYEVLVNEEWKENILEPYHTAYLQTDLDPENINDMDEAIKKEIVRVKFTDKQDIESLGWEFKDKCQWEIPFTYSFNEMGIGEVNNVKGAWKLVFTKDGWCSIVKDCYGETSHFRGSIRNKSELKMIMEMLDVKRA